MKYFELHVLDNRDSWKVSLKLSFLKATWWGGYGNMDAWRFVGIMVLNLLQ